MPHYADAPIAKNKSIFREINIVVLEMKIKICDPFIYETVDHPDFIVRSLMEVSIGLKRFKDFKYAHADLRLCWSHLLHCWKSHTTTQVIYLSPNSML